MKQNYGKTNFGQFTLLRLLCIAIMWPVMAEPALSMSPADGGAIKAENPAAE